MNNTWLSHNLSREKGLHKQCCAAIYIGNWGLKPYLKSAINMFSLTDPPGIPIFHMNSAVASYQGYLSLRLRAIPARWRLILPCDKVPFFVLNGAYSQITGYRIASLPLAYICLQTRVRPGSVLASAIWAWELSISAIKEGIDSLRLAGIFLRVRWREGVELRINPPLYLPGHWNKKRVEMQNYSWGERKGAINPIHKLIKPGHLGSIG